MRKTRTTIFKWVLLILVIAADAAISASHPSYAEEPILAGIISPEIVESGELINYIYHEDIRESNEFASLSEALPEYYRASYDKPALYQVVSGPCWAFGFIGALEWNLYEKHGIEADFSEAHLAYFAHNPVADGYTDKASETEDNLGAQAYRTGGNQIRAITAILRGNGLAYEDEVPYSEYVKGYGNYKPVPESKRNLSHVVIDNMYYYCNKREKIKQAVYDYGAVSVNYHNASYKKSYYNENNAAYYYYDMEPYDHCAVIVGWDDNFPKENFSTQPETDGAWIVRDSSGKYWGDKGYIYISYENSIEVFFTEVGEKKYDKTYGYIGESAMRCSGSKLYANCFTVKRNESLKAISMLTYAPGTADIYIFKNPVTDPDTGELLLKMTQVPVNGMYSTIELPEPITFEPGDRFSVVVFGVSVLFEGTTNNYTSNPGESYAFQYSWTGWKYNGSNANKDGLSLWTDTATGISETRSDPRYIWNNIAIYAFTDYSDDTPEVLLPVEIVDVQTTDNGAEITYYSENELPAYIYTAIYDEEGRLIEVRQFEQIEIQDSTKIEIGGCEAGQYLRVYLWSNAESVEPLAPAVEVR